MGKWPQASEEGSASRPLYGQGGGASVLCHTAPRVAPPETLPAEGILEVSQ